MRKLTTLNFTVLATFVLFVGLSTSTAQAKISTKVKIKTEQPGTIEAPPFNDEGPGKPKKPRKK